MCERLHRSDAMLLNILIYYFLEFLAKLFCTSFAHVVGMGYEWQKFTINDIVTFFDELWTKKGHKLWTILWMTLWTTKWITILWTTSSSAHKPDGLLVTYVMNLTLFICRICHNKKGQGYMLIYVWIPWCHGFVNQLQPFFISWNSVLKHLSHLENFTVNTGTINKSKVALLLLYVQIILPAEKETEGQQDRPDGLQIHASRLMMTNCRLDGKCSRQELSNTLAFYSAANLFTMTTFPKASSDFQAIPNTFKWANS